MVRHWLFLVVGLCLASGCGRGNDPPVDLKQPAAGQVGDWILGEPIQQANLTVFPLLSREPRTEDRFITLDEGLKQGTIEVLEVGIAAQSSPPVASRGSPDPFGDESSPTDVAPAQRANQVNSVTVVNKSDRPLYLMPGEIIVGGDQDRTIGREYVIQPDKKPVTIDVFCVEHGRWNQRGGAQYAELFAAASNTEALSSSVAVSGGANANLETAARDADSGKFVASVGSVSKEARQAVLETADQGEVWNKVASVNARSSVKGESGAFTGNYAEERAVRRLEPYLEKLQRPAAETPRIVGVVVAINGKVESLDAFESTPLFQKLWPKLLKSYALDAANADPAAATTVCSREAASQFVADLQSAPRQHKEGQETIGITTRSTDRLSGFMFSDDSDSLSFGGGLGGGVHSAGFAK